jgi:Pyridoxamine 5'-phosphate oxidase
MSSAARIGLTSMTDHQPTQTTNLDRYGNAELPWSRARDILTAGPLGREQRCFLGTVRPDGRPHAAGIGTAWLDGDLLIVSSPQTRKSRNLAENPACSISLAVDRIDLVFEGEAARITDQPTLEAAAAVYRAGGWPAEVEGDAFTAPYSAPSAGPPPWYVYRMVFHTAFGVASAEPHGATRWRFER